jgi:hypothetical protein
MISDFAAMATHHELDRADHSELMSRGVHELIESIKGFLLHISSGCPFLDLNKTIRRSLVAVG